MKKKSIVATLAVIAVSAIPLMAQELTYNIDEGLAQEVKASVQQSITQEQQHQNDAAIAKKYERLTNDYKAFVDLMKDKSLANKTDEVVGQKIFMVIDDLAQSILALPQPARDNYIQRFSIQTYRFAYQHNKEVNLKDLYELATSLRTIHTFDTTPIVKLLATQVPDNTSTWKMNEYDKEFLDLVYESIKEINYTPIDKLNKALDKVLEVQDNASLQNREEKYRAQVIWMAIDDFAQVMLTEFPEDERAEFMGAVFNRNISILRLQELYDFCKDYVYYHNSAIETLMNKYAPVSEPAPTPAPKKTSWWQGVIETFQHEK